MKKIDVRGKLCPEPLIITKKAIKEATVGDSFTVLLDNETATCNLENLLKEMGIEFFRQRDGSVDCVNFTLGASPVKNADIKQFCEIPTPTDSYVVVIRSEGMGRDSDGSTTLGKVLMRGFINSLAQQDKLPKAVILYNSGVLNTIQGADTVEALKELEGAGVDVLLCGVCVDYYSIKSVVQVGRISNMFEITKITTTASNVVYP